MMTRAWLAGLAVCVAVSVSGQEPATGGDGGRSQDPWASGTFSDFRLRFIGPALMAGRISHVAVHPGHKQTWYVGVASGGVWKTTNAGTTFTPVFNQEASYSIGAVVIDPARPTTIWVGTGEGNNQRSVGYGDGIYRSDDAGRTWRNMGLKTSEHVTRIAIDPRDSDVVPQHLAKAVMQLAGHMLTLFKGCQRSLLLDELRLGLLLIGHIVKQEQAADFQTRQSFKALVSSR